MLDKFGIAKGIAQEVRDGYYVNLGIGIPTLVANYIPEGINYIFNKIGFNIAFPIIGIVTFGFMSVMLFC